MFCDVFGLELTFPLELKKRRQEENSMIFLVYPIRKFIKMAFTLFGSGFFLFNFVHHLFNSLL